MYICRGVKFTPRLVWSYMQTEKKLGVIPILLTVHTYLSAYGCIHNRTHVDEARVPLYINA